MEKSYLDIDKIERYIKGVSDDAEKQEVRSRLAADEEFRLLFDDMEIITEGIRRSGGDSTLEEKIMKLDNLLDDEVADAELEEYTEIRPKIVVLWYNKPYLRAIAAGFALLVIAWFSIGPFSTVTEEELLAENFVPYPSTSGSTRGNTENDNTRDKAHLAYASEDYASALGFFEELESQPDFSLTDRFYLGNAYLALGEGEKAVKLLSVVVAEGSGLKVLAQWYLGLSYLQIGDKENARKVLTEVRDAGVDKSEEADIILKKLK